MSDAALFAVELVRTVPSRRRRRIATRLAAKLGADPERVRALLGRPPGPITKPIPEVDASQIQGLFLQEGIAVELIELNPDQKHDVFKTSTNLKLTSVVHRGSSGKVATTASGEWPDSKSWSEQSDWSEAKPAESDHESAVRLIARVPPQRIDGLVKRLAERLQVDPLRLRRLLSRPPGLLSKPISRATSERITSILSAEGVAVESVQLLDTDDSGPGSPDFDLRLTLDMARMRAQVGDPRRVLPSGPPSSSGKRMLATVEPAKREPIMIETMPPLRTTSVEDPAPAQPRPRTHPGAIPATAPTAPAKTAPVIGNRRSTSAEPRPSGGSDDTSAAGTVGQETPAAPKRSRGGRGKRSDAAAPMADRPPVSPNASPADSVPAPIDIPVNERIVQRPTDRAKPVGAAQRRRGMPPAAEPPHLSEDEGDVEIPPAPLLPEPRSQRAAAPAPGSAPSTGATRGVEPHVAPARRTRAAKPATGGVAAVAEATATRKRVEPGRRGFYTLLVFDFALLAVLGGAGPVLSSPGGITVMLLFSLLLLGQAMLARASDRPLSDLFAGLAVTPMFFMFPALVDTLSPWRELTAELQLVVISLLLLLSTLYLADTLGFDRYRLGLALWRRGETGRRLAARFFRALLTSSGGLLLQLAIGVSGLFVGVVVRRYLPSAPDALGLAGATPLLILVALLTAALAQELFFRGLLQQVGVQALGTPLGIALPAILFVLLFSGGPLGGNFLFVLLLALVSGLIAHLTGSVLGLSLMNGLALAVYLGLLGDPLVCFQSGVDLACLVPGWLDPLAVVGVLP